VGGSNFTNQKRERERERERGEEEEKEDLLNQGQWSDDEAPQAGQLM